jgi:hypothetical protein
MMIVLLLYLLLKQSLVTKAFPNGGIVHFLVFPPHPTKSISGWLKSVKDADKVDLLGDKAWSQRQLAKNVEPIMNNLVKNSYESLSLLECKVKLLELISRRKGENEDMKQIEALISTLEKRHTPILTLEFYNMAVGGMWKFIFSSEIYLRPFPRFLRLGEADQTIQLEGSRGNVTNTFCWELTQDTSCKCSGTFSIVCSCQINEGKFSTWKLSTQILWFLLLLRYPLLFWLF